MMPFGQFNTVVISVSEIFPLDKGHYISVNGEYVVIEETQHEILEYPIDVFNFQVEDYHTYYVASAGVLVHNSCSQTVWTPPDGTALDTNDALTVAENYLGDGYTEMSPGRFVSADGSRQVRMTDSDLTPFNNHAGAPHINLEQLIPMPGKPGKFKIDNKIHIYLIE